MVLFTSWEYIIFLVVSVILFYLLNVSMRPVILAVSGIIFYTYYAGLFVFLIIFEARAYFLAKYRKKYFFVLSIILSLSILFYFKYKFLFFNIPKPDTWILPLGISFFTFEFIHYLVDGYKNEIPNPNLKDHFAFIFFFPSMIAGPIKRYQNFVPQIQASKFSMDNILNGTVRIILGFFKKIVIADTLAMFTDNLISKDFVLSADYWTILLLLIAFSFKIYMDFSAYSDIALGSAALFGIYLPENFNWPYLSMNIADFWRRWHISLTSWFMDYVYKPLGGSRKGILFTLLNVIIVMFFSGLWHGAAWNFIAWGLYHGFFLAFYHLYKYHNLPKWPKFISIPITFIVVTLGWIFFLAPLNLAFEIFKKLLLIS
ncbi:MAG: MBOAT family O-acyltransferase [Nanoarchaeota archaeon]